MFVVEAMSSSNFSAQPNVQQLPYDIAELALVQIDFGS
jgi:hypothetical protein